METKLLRVSDPQQDTEQIKAASLILRNGGLVAIPTETVYGLAANALDPEAVANIFRVKGRPADNPLIVHIASLETLPMLAREIPQAAYDLAERFWPGPLTIILRKQECVPMITTGGLVEAIVDGGPCQVGVESTVITLAGEVPRLLRPGYVTLEQLCDVLGDVAVDSAVLSKLEAGQKAASPGMKYKHYAPKARVVLLDGDDKAFADYVNRQQGEGIWALAFGSEVSMLKKPYMVMGNTAQEQAQHLFECLRELDDKGAKLVYARCPHKTGVGMAVYNRMARAAAFDIEKI